MFGTHKPRREPLQAFKSIKSCHHTTSVGSSSFNWHPYILCQTGTGKARPSYLIQMMEFHINISHKTDKIIAGRTDCCSPHCGWCYCSKRSFIFSPDHFINRKTSVETSREGLKEFEKGLKLMWTCAGSVKDEIA